MVINNANPKIGNKLITTNSKTKKIFFFSKKRNNYKRGMKNSLPFRQLYSKP